MKLVAFLFLAALLSVSAVAQRPRVIDTATDASKATPPAAPQTMKAKYEGGIFGYPKTMEGTISFDDTNARLLFRKDGKEVFFIPYKAVTSAFADTQKRQPKAATIAGSLPSIYSLPARLIKTKVRYLTVQFSDPDTNVGGVTSFRLENKELIESALYTLAQKSGLVPRGEVYVRKRDSEEAKKSNP